MEKNIETLKEIVSQAISLVNEDSRLDKHNKRVAFEVIDFNKAMDPSINIVIIDADTPEESIVNTFPMVIESFIFTDDRIIVSNSEAFNTIKDWIRYDLFTIKYVVNTIGEELELYFQ